jgi:hypothetical protein
MDQDTDIAGTLQDKEENAAKAMLRKRRKIGKGSIGRRRPQLQGTGQTGCS